MPTQSKPLNGTDITVARIPVMEIFGPTIQGEGQMSGTVSHFVRTGGCGLRCSWCDSMFAVEPKQIKAGKIMMTPSDIVEHVRSLGPAPYVTFTGGDPCIHKRLGEVINILKTEGMRTNIETQGMLFPDWLSYSSLVTFSPKGPSSGNIVDIGPLRDWLREKSMGLSVCIKVVVFDEEDMDYALNVYNRLHSTWYDSFYITAGTPMGISDPHDRAMAVLQSQQNLVGNLLYRMREERIEVGAKLHVGCQQHVLIWPDRDKGV